MQRITEKDMLNFYLEWHKALNIQNPACTFVFVVNILKKLISQTQCYVNL